MLWRYWVYSLCEGMLLGEEKDMACWEVVGVGKYLEVEVSRVKLN